MLASCGIDGAKLLKDIVPSPNFLSALILSNNGCIKIFADLVSSPTTPKSRSAGYKYCTFPVC